MSRSRAQRVFDLQLDRTYLRAVLAVEKRTREHDDPVLVRLRGQAAEAELGLLALRRREGLTLPDERLRRELSLDDEELELLWTATGIACDPRLHPHAQLLSGGSPELGATLALHAAIH